MIREELLALADELEGMDCREGCRTCPADGTKDCRVDLPCEEAVARAASRRIREIAEHDACEEAATTVSAYDMLPDDDRKAIALVREHGGLGAVEKRLMPVGMEWILDVWPRWSNGEYCKFGDWWKAGEYGEREPQQLSRLTFFTPEKLREWGQDEGENFGYAWDCMRPSDTTYRPDKVEPPAPKVLDADGVEIRVGDVLYSIETGDSVTVDSIEPCNPWFVKTDGELQHCAKFTHRAPAIAADGEPLREGERVWSVYSGTRYTVEKITDGLIPIKCRSEMGSTVSLHPSQLTHTNPEPPDTYAKLYEDVHDERCGSEEFVRRCLALAERGA